MPKPTTLDNPEAVFVMHGGLYWKPLSCGYTGEILNAGVYEPFKPWRDVPDTLISVKEAMLKHTPAEVAVMRERAEKAVAQYAARESSEDPKV